MSVQATGAAGFPLRINQLICEIQGIDLDFNIRAHDV